LEGATAAQLQALARAGTELPDGNLAVVQLEDELRQMQAFAERLKPALAQAPQPVIPHALTVDLDGQIWRLTGQVTDLRTDVLVRWRYDAHRVTDYLDAWIAHLFACSVPQLADRLPRTEWHGREGLFTLAPCRDARTLLVDLIERYRAGLRTPLHFFPRSAWAWIEKRRASDARKAWLGQAGRRNGESRHPAYALAFRGVNDPLDERFQAHAQAIFGPLRDHLSQGDA
jgi:exodeoxyribonuclease V gamma subunit